MMIVIALIATLLLSTTLILMLIGHIPSDFSSFYHSLLAIHTGHSPYQRWQFSTHGPTWINLNTPILFFLAQPLIKIDATSAYLVWQGMSLLMWIICLRLTTHNLSGLDHQTRVWLTAITLLSYPMLNNFLVAQVGTLLAVLVIAGFHCQQRNQDYVAGLCWGLATYLKLFPGLIAIYLIVYRCWRCLAMMVMVIGLCWLASIGLYGITIWQTYWQAVTHIHWYAHSWNTSLVGILTRLSMTLPFKHPKWLGPLLIMTIIMTKIVAFAIRMNQQHLRQSASAQQHFAWTSVAMIWLSPLGWLYYWPIALVAFAVLLIHYRHANDKNSALIAVAIIGLLWPTSGTKIHQISHPGELLHYCINGLSLGLLFTLFWCGLPQPINKDREHTFFRWLPAIGLLLMLGWDIDQYLANLLILFFSFAHH